MIVWFMADLMESYGTLIKINLYFDYYSVIWDFFINKEIWQLEIDNLKQENLWEPFWIY